MQIYKKYMTTSNLFSTDLDIYSKSVKYMNIYCILNVFQGKKNLERTLSIPGHILNA